MNRLYGALPVLAQNLACTWAGYRRTRARFSTHFYQVLAEWKETRSLPVDRIRHGNTSGTTGTALRLAHAPEAVAEEYATVWRMRMACGVNLRDPHLSFGGQLIVPFDRSAPPSGVITTSISRLSFRFTT